jgi:hypothetical protein
VPSQRRRGLGHKSGCGVNGLRWPKMAGGIAGARCRHRYPGARSASSDASQRRVPEGDRISRSTVAADRILPALESDMCQPRRSRFRASSAPDRIDAVNAATGASHGQQRRTILRSRRVRFAVPSRTHGVRRRYHQTKFLASGSPKKYGVRATIRINISPSLMRRRCFPALFGAVVPVKAASADNLKRAICLLAGVAAPGAPD